MMKRLFALLLIAALAISFTACAGSNSSSDPTTATRQDKYYAQHGFFGLQEYLVDYGLVAYVDLSKYDPASTNEPTADAERRTAVDYSLIGASNGVRFTLNGSAFIDLYDFSNADSNPLAQKTLADINDDGKITIIEGLDELTGVISKSGKYVVLYNAKKSFDYNDIIDALKKW